ncbi:MAG: class II aldolase/adducin family protein [Spirochaetia bacterium]|jgi:rhamnose utilization protein RhaD (predicted bifunctional aldolase and dehydrogenase)|nr:class II aldolase/adducin family protein [Spirochaetia bacterium]
MKALIPELNMKELISLSHKYGADSDYVLAGGGNTSWKSDELMAVKASGTELGSITKDGFVTLSMDKLRTIRTTKYPDKREEREERALQDLMNSRLPGQEGRPSVESLLHAIIPDKYVVHTHPALVNGMTCSKDGKKMAENLFPDNCIWIPLVDPGYILAKTIDDEMSRWMNSHYEKLPDYIFLANHGVFLWGNGSKEVDRKYKDLFNTLKKVCANSDAVGIDAQKSISESFLQKVGKLAGSKGDALFSTGKEIRSLLESRETIVNLKQSLSPDHIVYMGHTPLICDDLSEDQLFKLIAKDYIDFTDKWGKEPKSILILGKGFISLGNSKKGSETARMLMLDAIRVIRISHYFGGPKFMSEEKVNFINTWEVEKYRAKLSENG